MLKNLISKKKDKKFHQIFSSMKLLAEFLQEEETEDTMDVNI
jgi:hypothetical protein